MKKLIILPLIFTLITACASNNQNTDNITLQDWANMDSIEKNNLCNLWINQLHNSRQYIPQISESISTNKGMFTQEFLNTLCIQSLDTFSADKNNKIMKEKAVDMFIVSSYLSGKLKKK